MKNKPPLEQIQEELRASLASFDSGEALAEALWKTRCRHGRIYGVAAGRMSFIMRALVMRLNQMGIAAGTSGDTYLPPLTRNDLLLAASSSGNTRGVVEFVQRARRETGAEIWCVTGDRSSPLAAAADAVVGFRSASTTRMSHLSPDAGIPSIQPMNSLNEQAVFLFFDSLILLLMRRGKITDSAMNARHFNME